MIKKLASTWVLAGIIGYGGNLQRALFLSGRDPTFYAAPVAENGLPGEELAGGPGDLPDLMTIKPPPPKRHFPIRKPQPKPQPTPGNQPGPKPSGTPKPPVTRPS